MNSKIFIIALIAGVCLAEEGSRDKRSASGYGDHDDGYGSHDNGYGDQGGYEDDSHGLDSGYGEHQGYEKKEYYKTKSCYQCAYSPPKTYYDKKVRVESHMYGKRYGHEADGGYGDDKGYHGEKHGGYIKKSYIPVPYTINGGWDKCLGPFDHYQAQRFGIDVWDCHSNCYVRKDPNGNIFRGCYKGEYGVDPYKTGCHYQAGAIYCFCEGDKCNNGAAPH